MLRRLRRVGIASLSCLSFGAVAIASNPVIPPDGPYAELRLGGETSTLEYSYARICGPECPLAEMACNDDGRFDIRINAFSREDLIAWLAHDEEPFRAWGEGFNFVIRSDDNIETFVAWNLGLSDFSGMWFIESMAWGRALADWLELFGEATAVAIETAPRMIDLPSEIDDRARRALFADSCQARLQHPNDRAGSETWMAVRRGEAAAEIEAMGNAGDVDRLTPLAEAGDPIAEAALGVAMCSVGRGEEASEWFARAAAQAYPPALAYQLVMTRPHREQLADPRLGSTLAFRLFRFPNPGVRAMALDFIDGPCIDPEERELTHWYADAVLFGDLRGTEPLVDRYANGPAANPVEALAIAYATASSRAPEFEALLSATEIAEADARAIDWYRLLIR